MLAARQLVLCGLVLLAAVSITSGARQLQQFGRPYAEKVIADPKKECPGYGNVGQCMQLCGYFDDRIVNGFDETITFVVDLLSINVTSKDTRYTVCDPLSGDVSDYSTARVISNVQDLPTWKLDDRDFDSSDNATICEGFPDAGLCEVLCDDLVGADLNRAVNMITAYHATLKDYNLVSKDHELVKCLPDSGLIIDWDTNKRLGDVRTLERTSYQASIYMP